MATIKAVIPPELLSKLREGVGPDETAEETVQGSIQITFPTAEVRYSQESSEVTVRIADDEMISAVLRMALYELDKEQPRAAAVKPNKLEARDARVGVSSSVSPVLPWTGMR
jgi:hypothetical protein